MGHTQVDSADDRIRAARQSLRDRVAALEDRVTATVDKATGTVDDATTAIRDTVENATSAVRGTVQDATQGIRSTVHDATHGIRSLFESTGYNFRGVLDIRRKVQDNPWQGQLLAVGAGIAARVIANRKVIDTSSTTQSTATKPAAFASSNEPGPLDELLGMVRRQLMDIGQTAVASLSKKVKHNIATMTGTPEAEESAAGVNRLESVRAGTDNYYHRDGVH